MKKLTAVSIVALMVPSLALAVGNHPMAGCGLGYLLLSHDKNDQVTQILGATTNGTFGTQTFGISSGTSGCTEDGAVKLAKSTEVYAEVNLDSLRHEMAMGQGEYVNTLASMFGANDANRTSMVTFMQSQYAEIFPTAGTTSTEMLQNLSSQLSQHPELLG